MPSLFDWPAAPSLGGSCLEAPLIRASLDAVEVSSRQAWSAPGNRIMGCIIPYVNGWLLRNLELPGLELDWGMAKLT